MNRRIDKKYLYLPGGVKIEKELAKKLGLLKDKKAKSEKNFPSGAVVPIQYQSGCMYSALDASGRPKRYKKKQSTATLEYIQLKRPKDPADSNKDYFDVLDHPLTLHGGHWESNRRKH